LALGSLCFVFILAGSLTAQTVSGTLRGTVTDPNGAVVPNASVMVRSTETGLERTVVSSSEGQFNFSFLPIGTYRVETSRTDFNRVVNDNVVVRLNDTTVLNITLSPGVSGEVT